MATNIETTNNALFNDLSSVPTGDGPRVAAIPSVTPDIKRLADAVDRIKEIVELREGVRGESVDQNVTWRDLFKQGIASIKIGGEVYTALPDNASVFVGSANDLTMPPAPTNFLATGGFATIILSWDDPLQTYRNHAYTQVWRSAEDNIGSAVMIGTSQSFMYNDNVGNGAKYYYWIKFVSTSDVEGPYNSVDGTLGETSLNPAYVLEVLSGAITESQLYQSLTDRIDLIDGAITLPNSVNSRLLEEANKRSDLAARLIGAYTGTDLNQLTSGLLYQEAFTRNTADSNLAQQIALLAAGVSGGFDVFRTWYFDNNTSGWQAATDCVVTAYNGWIEVNATGVTPSITLTSNLNPGINGGLYDLIKIRIKRINGSGWSGKIFYSTSAHGFSNSYYKQAPNPNIAVGEDAIVEWNMDDLTAGGSDWRDGTILNLKIEIGDDANDDFELDWIAVGRNAPGASVAAVADEATARASGDAAEATARTVLTTKILGVPDPTQIGTLADITTGIIYEEKIARSDAVSGVAQQVEGLSASTQTSLAQLSANIQQEATTRATQDSALATNISNVSAVANSKVKTYYQANQPTDATIPAGSLWYDTDDNNKVYRYNGSAWQVSSDQRIEANAAAITTETQARVSEDIALASEIATLSATLTNNTNTLNAAIQSEQTARADADQANANSITTLQATVNTNQQDLAAAISQEATARANADGTLFAQYTVKVDVNGRVSGFGLASTLANGTPTSEFVVIADRFAVVSPSNTGAVGTFPFVIGTVDGQTRVAMSNAYIQDLSVTNAKIGNGAIDRAKIADLEVTTAKIADLSVSTAKIQDLSVGTAKIANGSITNAKIGNLEVDNAKIANGAIDNAKISGYIQSSNYVYGSTGWKIDKTGPAEFNNGAIFRGTLDVKSASSGERMQMTNQAIKVYDSSGRLRVQIGRLDV